ncbi:tetratricopeptide repeat protein [Muriicola marianensis]|uniref:Tetratricopeptide repeat protein n=1 Tax=Muriicola marianensis TaxID=1324801 RepID=A0ABQ1QR08_9FLAO|nr:tetratricopeptide repeat protein [Muriicola marianensis]GGD41671.1 hypothetical protein GCM10011361_05940 [Muriicola marianensis]
MQLREFVKECHQRDVFKHLSIYIVSGWVLIQVFSEIREPFGLPKISMTYLLLVLIAGFPFYTYLIWRYRLKPAEQDSDRSNNLKIVRGEDVDPKENPTDKTKKHLPGIRFYSPFQKMYFAFLTFIFLLSLGSVSWIVRANFITEPDPGAFTFPSEDRNDKVAVLSFENNTMNADLDVVGKMAVDWIIHGITQNEMGQVISPKVLEQYNTVMKASIVSDDENSILTEVLKPGKVITGKYYLSNGKLLIQCAILDGNMNETLETIEPVSCATDNPLECIEELKQRLLGSLLGEKERWTLYEEEPPNYEAYKMILEAENVDNTDPEYLRIMNEAIALDSNYFEPKMHRITYYYNIGEFGKTDSLIQALARDDLKGSRQKNIVKLWNALVRGDNKKAFTYLKKEYNWEPDDLNNNSSTMVVALQFVNRPEAVDSIYTKQLAMEKIDSLNCLTCEYRFYTKGMADIALGRPEVPIEMFGKYGTVKEFYWVKDVLLYAFVRTGERDKVDEILTTVKLTGNNKIWRDKCLLLGKQFLLQGKKEVSDSYLDLLLGSFEMSDKELTEVELEQMAMAHFYKGDYPRAVKHLEELVSLNPDDIDFNAFLAMSLWKTGGVEKAEEVLEQLEGLRTDYQYGAIDYAKARYHAFTGNTDLTIQHLIRAVAAGKRYNPGTFHDDVLMRPYRDLDAFQNVLTFWH